MENTATEGISILFQYGILGVVCAFLMIAVIYLMKRADKRDDKFMGMVKEFNTTINTFAKSEEAQTIVMADLKQMITKSQETSERILRNLKK